MTRFRGVLFAVTLFSSSHIAFAQEEPVPSPEPPPVLPTSEPATEPVQPPPPPPPPPAPKSANAELYANLPALDLPPVDPDTLAFGSTFEMVAASASMQASGRSGDEVDNDVQSLALRLSTRYFASLEKTQFGFSAIASGADQFTRAESLAMPGDGSLLNNTLSITLSPEGRFYLMPGSPFFVWGAVDLDTDVSSARDTGNPVDDEWDSNAPGQLTVAAGVGAGRILSIDPIVRLKRLEEAVGIGAIPADVGSEIIRTWYALRNDIGTYRFLAYTMKHLVGASLLGGDPDLRQTYQALAVLNDPFIVNRRHGWEARLGFGVVQPFVGYDDVDEADPSYAIVGSAQVEKPMGTERQLSARAKLFIDVGDEDEAPRPWSLRLFGAFTQVFYTETYDPTGALSVAAEVGAADTRQPSSPFVPEPETGLDFVGSLAYSRLLNRGSLATAALNLNLRNDGVYTLTLDIGITWGIATGFYTPYNTALLAL